MYYILKFSESWSVFDGLTNTSRQLDSKEVECLKTLFPALNDPAKILNASQVVPMNPNKLMNLHPKGSPPPGKK